MDKVKKVLSSINKIAKEDKTLSRLVSQLDIPYGETAGNVISALGYGRKKRAPRKTGGAKKKRAPRKRGMGGPVSANARYFSAVGPEQFPDRMIIPPPVPARVSVGLPRLATSSSARAPIMDLSDFGMGKKGRGFGGFLKGLIQAPLAGLAATSGGLHGALGSFGKKRGGRKMLPQVMPPMYM